MMPFRLPVPDEAPGVSRERRAVRITRITGTMLSVLAMAPALAIAAPITAADTIRRHQVRAVTIHAPVTEAGIGAGLFTKATASAHGLEITMSIRTGQYFLEEMLPVLMLLSNHSARRLSFEGAVLPGTCERSPFIMVTGGSAPRYHLPWAPLFSCPNRSPYRLNPGQTRTATLLVLLPASGQLRLTAQTSYEQDANPFGSAWPSIAISVRPSAPPDRHLHLRRHGSGVSVTVRQGRLPHLLYQYLIVSGGTRIGTRDWQPLRDARLQDPRGALAYALWRVLVTAPGYTVASADYT